MEILPAGLGRRESYLIMQVLIGFSDIGQVLHTEVVTVLRPMQLIALAHARLAHFARVEVWEDTVCVFRCPPAATPWAETG